MQSEYTLPTIDQKQLDALFQRDTGMVVAHNLAVERLPRIYRRTYPKAAASRPRPVDFAAVPKIVAALQDTSVRIEQQDWKESALAHLREAMNERLADEERAAHFDIAGSRIFLGGQLFHRGPLSESAFSMWIRAGGI